MTRIQEIYKTLKFVSEPSDLTEEQVKALLPALTVEAAAREERRIKHLLNRSGLRPVKRLEDFDWKFNPRLPREELLRMMETPWERDIRNYMLIGPGGVGKTHLAKAACYKAILRGIPATVITCHDLIARIRASRNRSAAIDYYATVKLLCIDEIGYVFPEQKEANDIFQIISKRSEIVSTIVTTNLVPSQWGKIFEAATATAILDRLSLNGNFITCEGRSYRSKK